MSFYYVPTTEGVESIKRYCVSSIRTSVRPSVCLSHAPMAKTDVLGIMIT